jgi:hypothetical protein
LVYRSTTKHLCFVGHWIHNWPTLAFESSPGRLTSHLLSDQSRSILSTICTHIGATRILRKRIRLAIILHDRFSSAQIGFMFLCYSWHHVLDTGLFMVSWRHVQRNLDPRRSCPFDHRVTQQFSFFGSGCCPRAASAFRFTNSSFSAHHLYNKTGLKIPCTDSRSSSELVLDTLSRSWILRLPLWNTSVVRTRSGENNMALLERRAQQGPLFTSFLSRLDYPFDCRLPL